ARKGSRPPLPERGRAAWRSPALQTRRQRRTTGQRAARFGQRREAFIEGNDRNGLASRALDRYRGCGARCACWNRVSPLAFEPHWFERECHDGCPGLSFSEQFCFDPRALDRGAAVRGHVAGEGPGILLGWHLGGIAESLGEDPRAQGHGAHLVVLLQGQE